MELSLESFRSWRALKLNLDQSLVLRGPNGSGKTNILEALTLLSTGRSWRTRREDDFITWGDGVAHLKATSPGLNLHTAYSRVGPVTHLFELNGAPTPLTQFIGVNKTVLFTPESLLLLTGEPQGRRRFLHTLTAQCVPGYPRALVRYHKVLEERNELLRRIRVGLAARRELSSWDTLLAEEGSVILEQSARVLDPLLPFFTRWWARLGNAAAPVTLRYAATIAGATPAAFIAALAARHEKDILFGATSVGPHRDDLIFSMEGRPLLRVASRGQIRAAVLALKAAEAQTVKELTGVQPMVLLDDVFSELDHHHRGLVEQFANEYVTIITATEAPPAGLGEVVEVEGLEK